MNINVLTKEDLTLLLDKLNSLEKKIDNISKQNPLSDTWLDNQDVMQLLNISPRTLQNYRDTGVLSFSQVGGKIYYKASDIQTHLEAHYKPAFKGNKNAVYVK